MSKSFSQLSKSQQQARIKQLAANRKKYHLLKGLFRVTGVSDHGERTMRDGVLVRSLGYRVVVAGADNDEGLKNGKFLWINELINVSAKTQPVVNSRLKIADKLSNGQKSVLVSINYRKKIKHGRTFRDADAMYIVDRKQDKRVNDDSTTKDLPDPTKKPINIDDIQGLPF